MPTPIQTLLNPSIGIADMMPMPSDERLPQLRELATSVLQETGLESLYGAVNARTVVQGLLCPNVGDGTLVNPDVFSAQMKGIRERLREREKNKGKGKDDPRVTDLLENEIEPLMQNEALFTAYSNLMVGG